MRHFQLAIIISSSRAVNDVALSIVIAILFDSRVGPNSQFSIENFTSASTLARPTIVTHIDEVTVGETDNRYI